MGFDVVAYYGGQRQCHDIKTSALPRRRGKAVRATRSLERVLVVLTSITFAFRKEEVKALPTLAVPPATRVQEAACSGLSGDSAAGLDEPFSVTPASEPSKSARRRVSSAEWPSSSGKAIIEAKMA